MIVLILIISIILIGILCVLIFYLAQIYETLIALSIAACRIIDSLKVLADKTIIDAGKKLK